MLDWVKTVQLQLKNKKIRNAVRIHSRALGSMHADAAIGKTEVPKTYFLK